MKVNGKTEIPSDDEPLFPLTAGIDDALSLSARAIGYTLYAGSEGIVKTFMKNWYLE